METKGILVEIDAEIGRLQQVRAILVGTATDGRGSKRTVSSTPKKRRLSPESLARIAAAQKERWAKAKKTVK